MPFVWGKDEALADARGKSLLKREEAPDAFMAVRLMAVMSAAKREVLMVSPYFVPGKAGMKWFKEMRARGVTVKVVTNSLASTDVDAAHGGYQSYRKAMLREAVDLYELRPDPERTGKSAQIYRGSKARAALHAKILIIDRETIFVGSHNIDPRSGQLDSQNGILIRSPELAAQLGCRIRSGHGPRLHLSRHAQRQSPHLDDRKGRKADRVPRGAGNRLLAPIQVDDHQSHIAGAVAVKSRRARRWKSEALRRDNNSSPAGVWRDSTGGRCHDPAGICPMRVSGGREHCDLPTRVRGWIQKRGRPHRRITDLKVIRVRERGSKVAGRPFLQITTDTGHIGVSGELFMDTPRRLEEISPKLRELLAGQDPQSRELHSIRLWNDLYPRRPLEDYAAGRDPLTGQAIWNTRRKARHTATGTIWMALSAVDNALWDLRGKLSGASVSRLLGASREQLPVYLSLTPSDSLDDTRKCARQFFDQGFRSQKWFLLYGPPQGQQGFRANVGVVETVRTELGKEARLMFDFAVGGRNKCDWDVPYAVALAKAIAPFQPYWLEEPFSPEEIDSYARLKGETAIPLATGEHTYTRWNIRPFLDRKLVKFVQSDPEWCGGVSEWLQIAQLVRQYDGVCLVPHGHHVLAAAHVVASQPASLCPMIEYGVWFTRDRQTLQTRIVMPKQGQLDVPTEPGLGPDLDWKRIELT